MTQNLTLSTPILIEAKGVFPLRITLYVKIVMALVMAVTAKFRFRKGR